MVHLLFALTLLACGTNPDAVDPAEVELTEEGKPKVPKSVAAPPEGEATTEGGIAYKVLKKGEGTEHPIVNAAVQVRYAGWTTDGKEFDSSYKRGDKPASFKLNQVIEGWTEGVQEMVAGERRIFWIPVEKAYRGAPGKPAGMLVFDIELVDFSNPEPPPVLPEDQYTPPADATKLESGLALKTLTKGTGTDKPARDAKVRIHFTGWKDDGTFLVTTKDRPNVPEYRVFQAFPGWTEALSGMVVGEKVRAWIPEELMKIEGQRTPTPDGNVVFDLELIEIIPPQPAPEDVAAPSASAQTTESGLAYRVLNKGAGGETASIDKLVKVQYTGWTNEGLMFDSTLDRGQPATVPVRGPIPGWTEALQLMAVGDKWRLWLPENLTGGGRGAPQGPLVFDVELLEIKERQKPQMRPNLPEAIRKKLKAPAPKPE